MCENQNKYRYTTTIEAVNHLKQLKLEDQYSNHLNDDKQLQNLAEKSIEIWNECEETVSNWRELQSMFNPIKNGNFTKESLKTAIKNLATIYPTRTSNNNIDYIANYLYEKNNYISEAITGSLNPKAIDDIDKKYGGDKSIRSLLSKLFCLLNNDAYPIYDEHARSSLETFTGKKDSDLKHSYIRYFNIIKMFRSEKELTGYDYRSLDKFLWLYGQTL